MDTLSDFDNPVDFLKDCFKVAVDAADPSEVISKFLPPLPKGKVLVVGAGKAAASMAKAVEKEWLEKVDLNGLVITRYSHGLPLKKIECLEAGHPVPDEAGELAASKIFEKVKELTKDDLLLVLVSGGGSSLLSLPIEGISNNDIKKVTKDLLKSGAPITDINIVRKHVSKIQGGKLSLASKASVCSLIISDVVGDNPSDIASGPCAADPSTFLDSKKVLEKWKVVPPKNILEHIEKGISGQIEDTPKPGDKRLENTKNFIIATAKSSISAAMKHSHFNGIDCISMGDAITGEAKDVGEVIAGWANEISLYPESGIKKPVLILSGGECTVTVTGDGRGGRCAEFLLSVALKLDSLGANRIYGIAADTDGIDGVSPHAGVYFDPLTIKKVRDLKIDPNLCLENNNALGVFEPISQVITTGPTRTNVNDFRAILVL